jgi:type I restriction enzyme S subunit
MSEFIVRDGDLLIGMSGSLGKIAAYLHSEPALQNQRTGLLVLEFKGNPSFTKLVLKYVEPQILAEGKGIAVQNISAKEIEDCIFPLPPLAEQGRIASFVDELFSDLDEGVAALKRVQEKLKLYRASVLKAAVEGDLTAEWRAQHPNVEPASELLKRILEERRRRWEEDQLRKFKEKDQEPPKNWKAKHKEPVAPDTSDLAPLPEGWCWATMDQATWSAGYGTSGKCKEDNKGLAVLRIPNIIGGRLDLNNLKFAPPGYCERDEDLVVVGDLLIVRTNGSRNLIGRGAVVQAQPSLPLSFASYLIRLRLISIAAFLSWTSLIWDCFHVRRWIETRAATSAGQYNISLGVLAQLVVPLPPLAEQEAIVESVEGQLSVIDHLEAEVEAKLKSAQALRQAILRHAFTGQLVPQDPNDDPASELLKWIAAEREARGRENAAARRATKVSNREHAARSKRPRKRKTKGN